MNKFLVLFISLTIVSCQYEKKPQGYFFQIVSQSDTTCLKEIAEAKNDLEKGKLTYCHYSGNLVSTYLRSEKELIEILKKNKIDFRNQGSSCVVYEDQTEHCYCDLMQEKINQKYNEKFLDSLLNLADEKYLSKHINDTMYYANCDKRPNYPNDTDDVDDGYSTVMHREIDKALVYPQGYIKKPNYDVAAFARISLNINKMGEAKIDSYEFVFDIKSNHKYEKYFEEELSKIIKKTGWKPAKIRDQNVNSKMVMRYVFH